MPGMVWIRAAARKHIALNPERSRDLRLGDDLCYSGSTLTALIVIFAAATLGSTALAGARSLDLSGSMLVTNNSAWFS
jgi:hypothetical protein